MSAQSLIVGLIVIGALVQLASGQAVSSRAANPDEPRINADLEASASLGGQARNTYSQKLSGHRMMHFGKRPLSLETPVLVPQNTQTAFDMYAERSAAMPAGRALQLEQPAYPYPILLTPANSDEEFKAASRRQHVIDIVSNLLDISRRRDHDEQQQLQQHKQKRLNQIRSRNKQQVPASPTASSFQLMRLIQEAGGNNAISLETGRPYSFEDRRRLPFGDSDEIIDLDRHLADEATASQRSQNLVEVKAANEEQVDDQQAKDDGSINLSSRSVPIHMGADIPTLTRAQISNLLYGRQASGQRANSILGMGNFIKKTEPQKMTFMHFG